VLTNQTSSLRLGDDLSSLGSGLPKIKFGLDKKFGNKSEATNADSVRTTAMKNMMLNKLNSNLTTMTMEKMKEDRGEKLHYDYMERRNTFKWLNEN